MKKKSIVRSGARTTLLVIDVQNYFFDRRSPAFLAAAPAILPRINRMIEAARANGWQVVYTVHCESKGGGNLMATHWKHLPTGAESNLFAGLKRQAGEAVIGKKHYSAFMATKLHGLLTRHGTRRLVLCGVMTHLCVDTTARHGFMLGFQPVIVRDACCSNRASLHRAGLACLEHGFAQVCTSAKVLRSMPCTT